MSLLPSRPDASPPEDAEPRVIDVDSDDADEVLSALSSSTARQLLNELHDEPAPPAELAERVDTSVQNAQYHLDNLESAGAIEVVETAYSEKGREMDVYAPADQPLVIYAGDDQDRGTLRTALSRLLGALGVLAGGSLVIQSLYGESLLPWTDGGVGDSDGAEGAPEDAGGGDDGAGGAEGDEESQEPADGDDGTSEDGADGDAPTNQDGEDGADAGDGGDGADAGDQVESGDGADLADPNETASNATDAAPEPDQMEAATEAAANLPPGLLFFAGGLLVLLLVVGFYYQNRRGPLR